MKNEIISNIENPEALEKLYRENKSDFSRVFNEVYPGISSYPAAVFWHERLKYEVSSNEAKQITAESPAGKPAYLIFTVLAILVCGTIFKIPQIYGLDIPVFISNNAPWVLFPALSLFYLVKYKTENRIYVLIFSAAAFIALFMNLLPWQLNSDTRILSSLHFSFITWIILGGAFVKFDIFSPAARMQYLRRNGDMIILTGVLFCAGMLLIMLSVAMFKAIGIRIDWILENYVVVYGLTAAPFAANYMIESSPKMISRVAPFISKLFTPLMLVLMTGFLIGLVFFAKDPFNNREELIVFNILLTAIIAVIVFSFSSGSASNSAIYNRILLILSLEGMIINGIALSAILYRLFAFGITPNKIAVLGANILLAANLIMITLRLFQYNRKKTSSENVERSMTAMLPFFACWALIVAVIMPFVFGFK